ncbi:hypothetical protein SPAN111604_06745 [Sphingomonas antarctica]|uniref:hypothetical protein n=1 Tax=Sphingomonas antarctica TaxID=2040274 RepID=UPI0039EC9B11
MRAALLAGPLFVCTAALASLYGQVPHPVTVSGSNLGGFIVLLPISMFVGGIIGGFISVVGASAMVFLGNHLAIARPRACWAIVGGATAAIFCGLYVCDAGSEPIAFGLIVTGAACGWMAKGSMFWTSEA